MKNFIVSVVLVFSGYFSFGQMTMGSTFTYSGMSSDCPIKVTVSYHIENGEERPRILKFTYDFNVGDVFSFPSPLLSPGEFVNNTDFEFSTSIGSFNVLKSHLDASSGSISYEYMCYNGCHLFVIPTGSHSYEMFIDCVLGGI